MTVDRLGPAAFSIFERSLLGEPVDQADVVALTSTERVALSGALIVALDRRIATIDAEVKKLRAFRDRFAAHRAALTVMLPGLHAASARESEAASAVA